MGKNTENDCEFVKQIGQETQAGEANGMIYRKQDKIKPKDLNPQASASF